MAELITDDVPRAAIIRSIFRRRRVYYPVGVLVILGLGIWRDPGLGPLVTAVTVAVMAFSWGLIEGIIHGIEWERSRSR